MDYIKGRFFVAVPEEIRKIPRPVHTVVNDSGRASPPRYSVRERSGIRYVPGGNPQPRNGKVAGHIIDGEYVPVQKQTAADGPDMLSYGASALVRSVTSDMLSELLQIYPAKDAYTIVAIAALRVIKPEIAARRLSSEYSRTFISRFYPGLALSPNTVGSFLEKPGMDGTKRRAFCRKRADSVIKDAIVPYLLRNKKVFIPNQVWSIDTTNIKWAAVICI